MSKLKILFIHLTVLAFIFAPFSQIIFNPSRTLAQEEPTSEEEQAETGADTSEPIESEGEESGEYDPEYVEEVEGKIFVSSAVDELEFYAGRGGQLEIAAQDMEHLRNHEVDVRVVDYLLTLVQPEELGGYGFSHIKAGRLLKNYDSDGVGKYDRETVFPEEENRAISTHHRGQAVDISEVGDITCKLVERRHLGGSKTRWQAPRGIKVAWQSVDGIARTPTPRSPSLMESSTAMTAESIMRMLNEGGELDQYLDFVKGLDVQTMLTYVGTNMVLKNLTNTKISGDPMADSLINSLGIMMLEKSMPELPNGLIAQQNGEDARIGVAKASLEESLNLPAGSLQGYGWQEILKSAGERALENALGLPALFLDKHQLSEATSLDTVKAALKHLKRGDDSFDFIAGTIDAIQKNDEKGLRMAGVSAIASAFRLSEEQAQALEGAVKAGGAPDIDETTFPVGRELDSEAVKDMFSENPQEQREAQEALASLGKEFFRELFKKGLPRQAEGLAEDVFDHLLSGNSFSLEDLKKLVGANKLALDFELTEREKRGIISGEPNSKVQRLIASYFNEEYELKGNYVIGEDDINSLFSGTDFSLAEKIGGVEADKALGWSSGTGLEVIRGDKSLEEAAGEIFVNSVGQILGLKKGTSFSFEGDLQDNYSIAIIEDRLGLELGGKNTATDFDEKKLLEAFGLATGRSLASLREDSEFWITPENYDRLLLADARLGVTGGTSAKFLRGEMSVEQLKDQAFKDNLTNLSIDAIWNFFDLEDQFRLKTEESQIILDVLKDWNNAGLEKKEQAIGLATKVVGRYFDSQTNFSLDFFISYFTEPNHEKAASQLIDQGIRQLAGAFGVNLEEFDADELKEMTDRITRVFNGEAVEAIPGSSIPPETNPETRERLTKGDERILLEQFLEITGIPEEYQQDAAAFIEGDFRTGLAAWSATIWQDFANKYLPEDGQLTYEEMRDTFAYENLTAIEERAKEMTTSTEYGELYSNLSPEAKAEAQKQARKVLMEEARANAQYKISDAFIEQSTGIELPSGFSRIMFSGTTEERGELLIRFGITGLESALKQIEPSYQTGTLQSLFDGELTAAQADQIVLAIINQSGISFGTFDSEFVSQFYTFLRSGNRADFFTNNKYDNMWNFFDGWIEEQLGIGKLPADISKSLYHASENNWDLNAGVSGANGEIVVASLNQLGEGLLFSKLSEWGDKMFGLPGGSTYRVYQAVKAVSDASKALAAARAAGDAAKASQASSSLSNAQAELTVIAITIALNACEACQQFFSAIDKAIAAPPGFTNAAVAGAVAMAFGLGPAGLIIAAALYLFGTYRVDFLCPIPPPDLYALTGFDSPADQLEYKWGDHYADGSKPVKDSPKRGDEYSFNGNSYGENPFDWDDGVPFVDGNDPDLWRAWARYKTGQLLDASMRYGEENQRPNKPKQIITFRQANAEFFFDRIPNTFGGLERVFPSVGLGFTQTSTKTTDWVHVAFGGWF